MFDKFADYMQYLMPSAFKKQKKNNQLIIYCKAIGGLYDDLLQSVLRLREESALETCSHEMLEVFGSDYDMPQMQGETNEMYCRRLQMKALIAESAGTQQGILYALASVGYDRCTITPFYLTDPQRWAEIKINVFTPSADEDNPIAFSCIVAEVMKVKKASTYLHWRFEYPIQIWETDINRIKMAVRFAIFIQFWDCCIYNGQYYYDGTLLYDAKRNYMPRIALINKMRSFIEQHFIYASTVTRAHIRNNGSTKTAVRSQYSISHWGNALYNNAYCYDGTLHYDAKRNYMPRTALINRIYLHTGQHVKHADTVTRTHIRNNGSTKTTMRSQYSVSYWGCALYNSVYRYDGTLQYDAVRRYGLRMAASGRLQVHTIQAVGYDWHMPYIQIETKEKCQTRCVNRHTVKEPVPAKKYKVRIHMEIFFPDEKIDNAYVETHRNVKYYDGTLRYDGTARYDAFYRKDDIE